MTAGADASGDWCTMGKYGMRSVTPFPPPRGPCLENDFVKASVKLKLKLTLQSTWAEREYGQRSVDEFSRLQVGSTYSVFIVCPFFS
ncbi:hypothetical protein M378DRAFT_167816 [Amanita muscaria Koide BX008]|uniref:Uncharacterized protein n=1 Tax=Amanita muscaria (strain Koide BX008) TaxID=946122 RepID=A0A0C2SCP1_AMAMK|nr:hypothetical protein M378DRAFT_167816 [Amanita muscaria Koide BX008]